MKKRISLLAISLLGLLQLMGQVNDAGLWMSVKVEKEIVEDLTTELEMESRLYENFTEMESAFFDLTTEYKISSFMDVSADYRFGNKRQLNNDYLLRQRFAFNVMFDVGWKKLKFDYRFRYQRNFVGISQDEYGIAFSRAFRNKFGVKLNLPDKWEVESTFETWTGRSEIQSLSWTDWRVTAGIIKEISKYDSIKLEYLVQSQVNENNPLTEFIFRIGYSHKLD